MPSIGGSAIARRTGSCSSPAISSTAFWDYRFLFLILISTVIDFIGGLGVAGKRLSNSRLSILSAFLILSSILLCTNIDYSKLYQGVTSSNDVLLQQAVPHHLSNWQTPIATTVITLAYLLVLPRLYRLPENTRRKTFLWISMVANLLILGYFKYYEFFINSFIDMLQTMGISNSNRLMLNIILPAGISFYTFQAMSYTIDIYRNECEPTDDFPDFALFVCFFPHLVAGPIMRAHTLLPQVVNPRRFSWSEFNDGSYLVAIGLFKKMVLADNMAPIANRVFNSFDGKFGEALTFPDVMIGVYAFALQIYGDFSGYSAIARGISKWLGFELAINFDQPYLATSPSNFWRRWHISLSTWLRDYLYIPLGGNKGGMSMMYRNLMLTMLLGGLWHGASWTFVAWGLYHGAILCLFRIIGFEDPKPNGSWLNRLYWFICVIVMFHMTCFGWMLFRAKTFSA